MGHHSNNLAPLRLRRAHAKQDALGRCRLVRKRLRRERLINYQQVSIRRTVLLRERTSRQQRRTHRFEVAGQNDLQIGSLKLARIGLRFRTAPTHRTKPTRKRQRKRRGRTLHTRNRVELVAQLSLETLSLLRSVANIAEQLKRQQPARIESEIDTLNIDERAEHQPRANQQHKRERNFHDDHSITQTSRAECAATPSSA